MPQPAAERRDRAVAPHAGRQGRGRRLLGQLRRRRPHRGQERGPRAAGLRAPDHRRAPARAGAPRPAAGAGRHARHQRPGARQMGPGAVRAAVARAAGDAESGQGAQPRLLGPGDQEQPGAQADRQRPRLLLGHADRDPRGQLLRDPGVGGARRAAAAGARAPRRLGRLRQEHAARERRARGRPAHGFPTVRSGGPAADAAGDLHLAAGHPAGDDLHRGRRRPSAGAAHRGGQRRGPGLPRGGDAARIRVQAPRRRPQPGRRRAGRVRGQSGQRRPHPGVGDELRGRGLRHRRGAGHSGARPAQPQLRGPPQPADPPGRARGRRGRDGADQLAVHPQAGPRGQQRRAGRGDQPPQAAAAPRRQRRRRRGPPRQAGLGPRRRRGGHRLPRRARRRRGAGDDGAAARLEDQPAGLLGLSGCRWSTAPSAGPCRSRRPSCR